MAVASPQRPAPAAVPSGTTTRDEAAGRAPTVPRWRPVEVAMVVLGIAMAVIVAVGGSPLWAVLRVAVVAAVTRAGLACERHDSARAQGFAAVGLGALGLATGVGIAVPHLAKSAFGALAVAGTVAAVAGLVMVVLGLVTLARAWRGWARVAVLAGALVVVALVGEVVGVAVAATNVAPTRLGAGRPSSLGLAYEDVSFETSDGVVLSGWWIPGTNGAAVVLAHGSGSTRTSVLGQAGALARAGYGVLLFDARGHGRSGGRAMDFGWNGDEDVSAAVGAAARQPGVDPDRIAVVGESMGGEEAIGAAASDPRVAAVVAEGATARVAADRAYLVDRYGWRGRVQQAIDALTYGTADVLTEAYQPMALASAVTSVAPRPMMLMAAGSVPDEAAAAARLEAAAPDAVQVWVVPGAAHAGGFDADPQEWAARVTGFLDRAMP